jgi:predicted dehydrogenase
MTTFAIVGTGWRGEFFLRLARHLPDRLGVCGVVTRSTDRAERMRADWGVATYLSTSDLLAHERPEYVIVSVPWDVTPAATVDLVGRGVRVLAETPPAPDVDGLRALWGEVGASGLVQVAEQYRLMPGHAARLALTAAGTIGAVTSVQLSSTHMYHAVSLMRAYLGVGYEPAQVWARRFTAGLVDPLNGRGWTGDDTPKPATTTLSTVDFGGRMGLYDFTDNQWWNPLRARRLVVRGERGEIVDDRVIRLLDPTTPDESSLARRQTGHDLNLEGLDLKHIAYDGKVVYRSPYVGSGLSDDDIAVAALLEQTGAWARGEGPPPYPLAQGCQDHLIALAMDESVRRDAPVWTDVEPWAA